MRDFETIESVCTYCGVGCDIAAEVSDNKIEKIFAYKDGVVSEGKLCIKGWNLHEFVMSEHRLKSPLIKDNGQFKEVSWDQALSEASHRFKQVIDKYGPDSVGVLCSAKITSEENYLAQKFARAVLGTNNVDHCARL